VTLDPLSIALFLFAVALLGLSKGGLAGIGMMSMPLLLLVMPPAAAAGLMLPILIIQDALSLWLYRGQWDRGNLRLLLPSAGLGIVVGMALFAVMPERALLAILGVVTVAFATRGLVKAGAPAKTPHPVLGVILGALSGFTSTVLHQGGPPFQIYLLPQKLPRDVFVGTTIVFFAVLNIVKLPGFVWLGQITREGLVIAAVSAPFALLMTWVGAWIVRRIDPVRFYTIIHVLLLLVGVELLFEAALHGG
jgi:uncharacterized membrane protein YfcA